MTGIQLLAIAAGALMLFYSYNAFRRGELAAYEFAVWCAIWLAVILVSLFAAQMRGIVAPLAVARLLDLVIIAGMIGLGYLVMALNRSVRRLERRLTALVRALALDPPRGAEPAAPEPERLAERHDS